jgi:hypothetical protein
MGCIPVCFNHSTLPSVARGGFCLKTHSRGHLTHYPSIRSEPLSNQPQPGHYHHPFTDEGEGVAVSDAAEGEACREMVTNGPLLPGRILPSDYLG